jgi:hypothetical protein
MALESQDIQALANALKGAVEETAPIKQIHISRYVAKTPFNPEGKKKHERSKLKCEFLQNGFKPNVGMLFDAEIDLINQLKPGRYLDRKVEVIERNEAGKRSIELRYDNASIEQRMEMKNVARSLGEMLEKIVAEQKPTKAAK